MNCLINKTIYSHLREGRKPEVIARYVKMKYRVNIDKSSIQKRQQLLDLDYAA
jgi:hypothetical protein